MKMAFLTIHSSPLGRAGAKDTGGMSTYLRGLSEELGDAGHSVDLFTRAAESGAEKVRLVSPNVRLISLSEGKAPLAKEDLYPHLPALADAVIGFCREEGGNYDLVFSHYWISGCVGTILQAKWQVPHLIMFHTLGRAKNEACPGENEPALRLAEEEKLARTCDIVVVAAATEKENILNLYNLPPEQVAVIPCGVDRSLFRPLGREKSKAELFPGEDRGEIILAVGRIEPVKGFELLINAVGLLSLQDKFNVVIIGGDHQSSARVDRLKESAADLGLHGRVTFTGLADHHELPLYYSAASVTVIPSYYESFGLVALESIACGTPVVAAKTGVFPELLLSVNTGPAGALLENRTPADWAAQIGRLLTRPKPIALQDIDQILAPFSWKKAAAQLLLLIEPR